MESCTVIKCGGSTLDALPSSFYKTLADLQRAGNKIVIVHGGGPAINQTLEKLNIPVKFVDGLRYTCEDTIKVVEMVLGGVTNKQIVRRLHQAGARAWGICGSDGGFIQAKQTDKPLGLVGEIVHIKESMVHNLLSLGHIPVIAPIGVSTEFNQAFNINADVAAGAIASAIGAKRLLLVTDVPGILKSEADGMKQLIPEIGPKGIQELISSGVIYGGMIPKVQSALDALQQGVPEVTICQGKDEDLRNLIAGKPVGTSIKRDYDSSNQEKEAM